MKDVCELHQPKQCMPERQLPPTRIDLIVDYTADHRMPRFMDAYSSYNHIPIYQSNQEKIVFIINHG